MKRGTLLRSVQTEVQVRSMGSLNLARSLAHLRGAAEQTAGKSQIQKRRFGDPPSSPGFPFITFEKKDVSLQEGLLPKPRVVGGAVSTVSPVWLGRYEDVAPGINCRSLPQCLETRWGRRTRLLQPGIALNDESGQCFTAHQRSRTRSVPALVSKLLLDDFFDAFDASSGASPRSRNRTENDLGGSEPQLRN
jgi:hypothetical protein